MGAALVLRPSRGRNARSESVETKPRRKEEVEGRDGGAVNKEKMQQLRSSKVGWNLL